VSGYYKPGMPHKDARILNWEAAERRRQEKAAREARNERHWQEVMRAHRQEATKDEAGK